MMTLNRLELIIPPDQALANKALATSLAQIGGIANRTLPEFSAVVAGQQTTKDLPLITPLPEPVPASVANSIISTLAQGTGPDGTVLIVDILGTAAGWISTDAFLETIEILSTMNTVNLETVYETMLNTINGVYTGPDILDPMMFVTTIPPGLPGAGTYGPTVTANESINLAFSAGLIPAAQSEIAALVIAYPNQTQELNTLWNNIGAQLSRELTLQSQAQIDFATLTANQRTSIYGFVYALPDYGSNTQVGGPVQLIEGVADLTTFTGQAIVACLREGKNQTALSSAGILTSNQISTEPAEPPPEAQLIPSEYSENEAIDLVVK
jgi:hypothetical protein